MQISQSTTIYTCVICGKDVDSDIVHEDFEGLFQQVDFHGMESATEQEQVVLEGSICSYGCFEKLQ